MGKINILILICLLLLGCNVRNSKKEYYFNNRNSDIYSFDNSEIVVFNNQDSTSNIYKYMVDEDEIIIQKNKFKFEKKDDSIIIHNFFNNQYNLNLIKFKNELLDFEKIHSNFWSFKVDKNGYLQEQIIKISKDRFYSFYIDRDKKDTIYGGVWDYKGKRFNRFHFYQKDYSSFLLYSNYDDKISSLIFNGYDKTYPQTLVKIKSKNKLDSLINGTWKQTNINDSNNLFYFERQSFSEFSNNNFRQKIDILKKRYDLSLIEIRKNNSLKIFSQNDGVKTNHIEFGITGKLMFVEKFSRENSLEIFEIKKITNDSLTIKLFNKPVLFKFCRIK